MLLIGWSEYLTLLNSKCMYATFSMTES